MASTPAAGIDGEQLASLRGDLRMASSAIPVDDLHSAQRRFLALLERPMSVGFSIGWIDTFVQLGPAFLDDRLVMLPSCVTNFSATLRGSDYLSPQVVPHVTLGKLAVGMGRVVGGDFGLEWHVSGPSTVHPEWDTPVWSREIRHIVPIGQIVEDISRELLGHRCFVGPLPGRMHFDSEACRWVLDAGVALDVCGVFRGALERYGWTHQAVESVELRCCCLRMWW